MEKNELEENKIVCLKQLRLSKWQLIWIKEFEITSIQNLDKKALAQAELSGKHTPEEIKKGQQMLAMKTVMAQGEIEKAKIEIKMLDDIIYNLEVPSVLGGAGGEAI